MRSAVQALGTFTGTGNKRIQMSGVVRSYSRSALSMKLQTAIVGLPNVGKSTLFNALTETQGAEAANYPFCTSKYAFRCLYFIIAFFIVLFIGS